MKLKATYARFDKNTRELSELTRKYNYALKSNKWKKVDEIEDAFTKFTQNSNVGVLHFHIKQQLRLNENDIIAELSQHALKKSYREYYLTIDGSTVAEYLIKARKTISKLIIPDGINQYNFQIRLRLLMIKFKGGLEQVIDVIIVSKQHYVDNISEVDKKYNDAMLDITNNEADFSYHGSRY